MRAERVLVAASDAAVRLFCRLNLEEQGFEVVEAETAAEVRAAAAAGGLALVCLDIGLGNDEGIDLAKEVREALPDLGVVFITGVAGLHEAVERALAGSTLDRASRSESRRRQNAALYASARQRASSVPLAATETVEFLCECGDSACTETVLLTSAEYVALRRVVGHT